MNDQPHVCPWWVGYLLASPLRRLVQNPEQLLAPHVRQGMATLDFGCAMGFFSLPLAKLVGREGTVLCVDCQPFMLDRLMRRARRAKLDHVIEPRLADRADFGLATERSRFDLALAIAVAHEVPDQRALFAALHASLRPDGGLLFCEPAGHVTRDSFETELGVARDVGFGLARRLDLRRTHTAVLRKLA